ncbi:AmmeMemoRadiSam system protein A [Nitrosomonas sp. JL21]|uniref:AmmeMemoRadiSam system protein A n=1 Tax=Nitrosomonas sp. JL21 TaxID=153949 RepID=UPI001368F1EC|nr:AmmeMemoRadiSam system protein A [Nitrosomonas sp. JL21]MBL8498767.1 AmmeMemoRadiSam system protein A [Nitrosomonas sp.]MCC7092082.1 AmmeMemoRadiSam system protein A [Nitrosomonas sp.]MXS78063.1 AmmeMemoRadiSam system protein A [Nitrosomonas sp. JL21]
MITPIEKNEQGKILLSIARTAISRALSIPCCSVVMNGTTFWLSEPAATFVTLTENQELRGCIGSLYAYNPLIKDVSNNAVSAALHDPRFTPLTANELNSVSIEVSLLSRLQPIDFKNEKDVFNQLHPGIDGLVLEYGPHRSTFLPQVWENFPQPQQFLAKLKSKARLSEHFWTKGIKLSRYTVSKWSETACPEELMHG